MKIVICTYPITQLGTINHIDDSYKECLNKIISILPHTLFNWDKENGSKSPYDAYVKTNLLAEEEFYWFDSLIIKDAHTIQHIYDAENAKLLMQSYPEGINK